MTARLQRIGIHPSRQLLLMDARDPTLSVLEWDEDAVIAWLSSIGFPQYANQIRAHNISGDVLTNLDQDTLKEVGVETIGQRLAILKAVYYLKLSHNVPIDTDHYVPPSEIEDDHDGVTLESLHEIVKEQWDRLRQLEYENKLLQSDLRVCLDELGGNVKTTAAQARLPLEEQPLNRQSSFRWASYVTPARSPTRIAMESEVESPRVSPSAPEHDILHNPIPPLKPTREAPLPPTDRAPSRLQQPPPTPNSSINGSSSVYSNGALSNNYTPTNTPTLSSNPSAPKPSRSESNEGLKDGLKSFKVSLEDPAWKVLPAALKKYKINNDDWQNYAMFICYGNTERCLSYDEKPLLLFQRLKDAKKNPVFMLKHIRDIRSPIVVAQQKQAARQMAKASEAAAAASASTPPTAAKTQRMAGLSRQQSLRAAASRDTPQTAGASATSSTAWPTSDTMTPSMERKQEDRTSPGDEDGTVIGKDIIPAPKDISYAVAIYPYMAEQEDEFDVVVGDTFIILQRARGWWVVQRDPSGSGIVENDPSKQGWVPAGCLLETSVPVASAVAEATGGNTTADGKPILPLSIISTSFPGIALMDYLKKGDEELDLKKDDVLRVFKRYNHWSYAVKEEGGARGWVPSWFIGKVAGVGVPFTPNTTNSASMQGMQMSTSMLDPDIRYASEGGMHSSDSISPISPGFPSASTLRTTTVV